MWIKQLLAHLSLTTAVPLIPFTVPACLPLYQSPSLPASPARSVYNIKARHSNTSGHATAHPSSTAAPCRAEKCPLCMQATSKTPAEMPRLCWILTTAQSRPRHCHESWGSNLTQVSLQSGMGVKNKERCRERRRSCRMLRLVLCLWLSGSRTLTHITSRPSEGMTCHSVHMYKRASEAIACSPSALRCLFHSL